MKTENFTIRPIHVDEISSVATLLANAYYDDLFFHWCVADENDRLSIVSEYYKIYLQSKGCIVHIAENSEQKIIGATVWLPHDAEESMYEEIEKAVGKKYAPYFAEVAEKSHANEPKNTPFYQLVGFGVDESAQGQGIGQALLQYQLEILDKLGIPTYLEASSEFTGAGVYGKFGYELYSDLMHFTDTAVLYPLFRQAKKG